jgi:L-alanine-DL-glutamate epimerase-like enolase superfamily enzyme
VHYEIKVEPRNWLLRKPFKISREESTHAETLLCHISDGAHTGSGEAAGVSYRGETIDSIKAQIEAAIPQIADGISRDELQQGEAIRTDGLADARLAAACRYHCLHDRHRFS